MKTIVEKKNLIIKSDNNDNNNNYNHRNNEGKNVLSSRTKCKDATLSNFPPSSLFKSKPLLLPPEVEVEVEVESYYLLGRRNVFGYTLRSGYVLRNQIIIIELGGKQNNDNDNYNDNDNDNISNNDDNNNNNNNNKTNDRNDNKINIKNIKNIKNSKKENNLYINNNLQKNIIKNKDKFSGGKMMFHTIIDSTNVQQDNKLQKNVNGRLPNFLCDFLFPLISANLIDVKGHIAYDIGSVGIFVDIPISIHILVSNKFLMLTENNNNIINNNKNSKNYNYNNDYDDDNNDNYNNDNSNNNRKRILFIENRKKEIEREKVIIDHASDLLLW